MKKILFVSLQGYSKSNKPTGMVRIINKVLDYFPLPYFYLVGENNAKSNKIKTPFITYKFILYFLKVLKKFNFVNYSSLRFIQEFVFDLHVLFHLRYKLILITTTPLLISSFLNKVFRGTNIYIAGNPSEDFIKQLLIEIGHKYNIDVDDVYTNSLRNYSIRSFLNNQDLIITQTKISYDSYLKGISNRKSNIIINCPTEILPSFNHSDTHPIYNKNHNILRFVYLAHSVWLKGLPLLLDGWNKANLNCAQLIIGGSIDPSLQEYINTININGNVKFSGPINPDDISIFYKKGEVCIVPSLIDNHPATIAEAMSFGLPVIATKSCGSSSLITDKINGLVVESISANGISEALVWMNNNRSQLSKMSKNAFDTILSIDKNLDGRYISIELLKFIDGSTKL